MPCSICYLPITDYCYFCQRSLCTDCTISIHWCNSGTQLIETITVCMFCYLKQS